RNVAAGRAAHHVHAGPAAGHLARERVHALADPERSEGSRLLLFPCYDARLVRLEHAPCAMRGALRELVAAGALVLAAAALVRLRPALAEPLAPPPRQTPLESAPPRELGP